MVHRQENLRVLDLGSGTEKLTKYLYDTLAAQETLGIDASENMLQKARQYEVAVARMMAMSAYRSWQTFLYRTFWTTL
ncbi:class I SAM-dependent methyltransferase [Nostoc sp. CHAB 5824]|nr:class I SAM-dependent methyltransferase [Nostoc sp. CHAB 5824]